MDQEVHTREVGHAGRDINDRYTHVLIEAHLAAAEQTAARLLWLLTAPWPWTARPVVRGPRRARQEARARGAGRSA